MSIDEEYLLKALENENNNSIVDLTTSKIKQMKNDVLQKLQLSREDLKELHKQLKYYRYVDDIKDINYGCYIRWINLKKLADLKLTKGGFICDIKVNEGIHLVCKNRFNHHFELISDENLIFQKITDQEHVILNVLDHLQK